LPTGGSVRRRPGLRTIKRKAAVSNILFIPVRLKNKEAL
jgi:hypothetical protein